MSRIAYVDGRYVRHANACVHIEDRGYQFADAVYEVWSVFNGRLADTQGHLDRLDRSLNELRIETPMTRPALLVVLYEVIRRNRIKDGMVYLQVSRGAAPRDHFFPAGVKPTLVITARSVDRKVAAAKAETGIKVITQPDIRWGRCDIKTVGLLPNVLAKQAAKDAGASDVLFVDSEGFITEGGSANAYIVDQAGVIRTRSLTANILAGITRAQLLKILGSTDIQVKEEAFSVAQALGAKEVFVTAATSLVMPIVDIDGHKIADGKPGPVATALRAAYIENAIANA
ncbi:D-amino-acid transaminase [Asticcacaulis endophyticus]|uniref:Probable branched-chain-amino-acid aminotransferase n=1 Tax=Asticcacaulis endophyticus TaxID=1395890 RepID=A0A918UV48_9CAUL|nr:D-amino-acid transaminase [Asticcacaulis endophyticus]GGZ37810.1 D-alanine aminotransferase [Asticcacaulis endophyticus]